MRRFYIVVCWESQNLQESVVDIPLLIELTVDEDITSYGHGSSGADLFLCTMCYVRLSRFEKAKKNAEGIKGRSTVLISSSNEQFNDKELIKLCEMSHTSPNKLQR